MSARIVGGNGAPRQHPVATSLASKTQSPRHISPTHWAELLDGSGITPALAAANFRSFGPGFADPEAERQALLAEAFAQLNPQPGHSYQARLKLQQRYAHLDGGGWRFIGDALPGCAPTPRWKPDQPRISSNGRPIKYEAQPGRRPGLLLPQVPITVWRLIAERHGLPMPADRSAGFWAWVLAHPELPVTLCEGEKKSCSVLSLGLVAVGLPGVELGRQVLARDAKNRATAEALVPELAELAKGGRRLLIAFDTDPKPATRLKVEGAAIRLGHLLEQAGAAVQVARLPLLNGDKCGPDDLLVAQGPDVLLEVLADGLALAELAWERRYWAERRCRATLANLRAGGGPGSLVEALQQTTADVVGVRAPKGFGKTEALALALADRPQVLAITHRRSLGAALASRLGLIWRNDTDSDRGLTFDCETEQIICEGLPPRYALCIDSLEVIKPETYAGAVVVLDEASQVGHHLLTSTTCSQKRGLLIQRLQQVCAYASQVIALDADLSDATLNWLQQARAGGRATSCAQVEVALLVGECQQHQPWPVHWYEQGRPEAAQQALLEAAARGPVFITTDSKERAAALHDLLQHHLPQAEGLLISSKTTGRAEVQAWLGKLTSIEALAAGAIRWVVASPSISSGLNITHGHFRSVFGFFGAGSMDDAEAVQALARVRQPVPRHVWVAPVVRPAKLPLSSAWWPQQVERDLRQRWSGQAALMRQQLQPDLLLAPDPGAAAEALAATCSLWADLQSRRNYSLAHLRSHIKARLRAEGHHIRPTTTEPAHNEAELRALKAELRSNRQQAHAEAVAAAPIISRPEADRLRRLGAHSPALQRRALVERLALAPEALTPELVIWGERWAGAAERLACLLEPELALRLDLQRMKATTPEGQAPLPFDQTYRAQRSRAAALIGLRTFIEAFPFRCRLWDRDTPQVVELAKLARENRQQLELALGLKIKANDTDTALVGALLTSFGITTTASRSGSTCRSYGADSQQLSLVRAAADRLRCKHSDLAPPSAGEGRFANKTACGGAPQQQPLAEPLEQAASCEQLPLLADSNGQGSVQCAAGSCASSQAPPRGPAPSPNPWRPGGRGHRAAAIQ
jgi:hypothetical protein